MIARFRHQGLFRLGAVVGAEPSNLSLTDLSAADPDLPDDAGALLASGALARSDRREFLEHLRNLVAAAPRLALDEVHLEAPIPRPPSFLAVGLNYQAHASETGRDPQLRSAPPIIFNKQITCVTGPFDPILIPEVAPDHVDYEGELGVVIGTACRAVPVER
ncbi:MAG: fumarylacetoacetate hydrolase family protein, partial [Acidimicrobiales bacterium]